jgi:hypothetical protein
VVLPLSLFRVENRVCLSRGVQVAGAAWRAAMRIFVSSLRSCGPLAYSDNERAKQLYMRLLIMYGA